MSAHLSSTASLYRYGVRRLIDQVSLDEEDLMIQHQNVDKVAAYGLEMQLDGRFDRGLITYASYAWQNAENSTSKERLSNQPSHVFKGGLSVPITRFYL